MNDKILGLFLEESLQIEQNLCSGKHPQKYPPGNLNPKIPSWQFKPTKIHPLRRVSNLLAFK